MNYLDNNATMAPLPKVLEAMEPYIRFNYANPGSSYRIAIEASRAVEGARREVAELLDVYPDEVVFTSGATEANNAALHSAVFGQSAKTHIITSQVEHSSIINYCRYLQQYHKMNVTYLQVDRSGAIDLEQLKSAITKNTALVSVMTANNETGIFFPIEEIAAICRSSNVPFHTDAVQAAGKTYYKMCANYISVSGHKFGALKGIGALAVRNGIKFLPLIIGGKQQNGRRGGTEAVPSVVGLGVAAKLAKQNLHRWEKVRHLRDYFEEAMIHAFPDAEIFGKSADRLPNTTNVRIPGLDGDAAVTFLDRAGICISSGSACMDSSIAPSHVIQAMTGSYDEATECIRISTSINTTQNELDELLTQLILLKEMVS